MTKTPDEIKNGLECCGTGKYGNHKDCPYDIAEPQCMQRLLADALALIRQLEAERDAAVKDIYEMAKCIEEDGNYSVCVWCDQTECERLCMMHLIEKPGFKWRGVQKEDIDA